MSVPPVAHRTLCVDFDATLFPWGPIEDDQPPLEGAIDFMRAAKKAGFKIVIFTSRMSKTWWQSEVPIPDGADIWDYRSTVTLFGIRQQQLVESRLEEWGIPYDLVTAEKVPAEYYIDDRAIEFTGDWSSIQRRVLGGP